MRKYVCYALFALMPLVAAADEGPARESPVGILRIDTPDASLYYYDYLSYLIPHAVRTFTNSLAWQRRTFGWVPSETTIILLQDFSDYGNAKTFSVPHNLLVFDIAPVSRAFETFSASETVYNLMNHELVHVVQGDMATEEDERWRRFFLGKVEAQAIGQLRDDPLLVLLLHSCPPGK